MVCLSSSPPTSLQTCLPLPWPPESLPHWLSHTKRGRTTQPGILAPVVWPVVYTIHSVGAVCSSIRGYSYSQSLSPGLLLTCTGAGLSGWTTWSPRDPLGWVLCSLGGNQTSELQSLQPSLARSRACRLDLLLSTRGEGRRPVLPEWP